MAGGQLGVVLILAGLPALLLAPPDLGAIRVAGVSLAWWYGGVVAPVLALVLALLAAGRPPDDRARPR